MPCANCKTYYAADLKACPVCKGGERVSPTAVPVRSTVAASELCPDPVALEEERERFLRDFKAQVFASQLPINVNGNASCAHEENHPGGPEPAAVCQGCYDHLQERVDVLEAALHMDLKEAAQIVYDAVWADPSDPTKTYENAAHALLAELRKTLRSHAGVRAVAASVGLRFSVSLLPVRSGNQAPIRSRTERRTATCQMPQGHGSSAVLCA